MKKVMINRCWRTLSWGLVVLLLAVCSDRASGQITPPQAPLMTLDEGKLLVNLARNGMLEYIKTRTGSDKQTLAPSLKELTKKLHPATVTLRSSGRMLVRSYRADTNVCRSVLAAALEAMRSSNLPDRVTPSVIAGLTVEVEVHGNRVSVSPDQINAAMTQGLTGLMVSRQGMKGIMLPSTACNLGVSPSNAPQVCLGQLPKSPTSPTQPDKWSIFRSRHYVGYPDKTVVPLYRGKTLIPARNLTNRELLEAASTAGLFILNSQQPNGAYRSPNRRTSIHEHLYATYAMAKLSKIDKRKLFSRSVQRALAYAARFVLSDDQQARVLARTPKGKPAESPTIATAWMLLAISELPPDPANKKVADKLARALQQDVVSAVGPGNALATPVQLRDWSVALLALRKHLPPGKQSARTLEPLTRTVEAWIKSGRVFSPLILRGTGTVTQLPHWRQIGDSDLPDRRGGFVSSRAEPLTAETAWAAVCLMEAVESGTVASDKKTAIARQVLRARQFCLQMLYRSREAYWTGKRTEMIGGMRTSPAAASVSLEACAAAVEAFAPR